MFDSGVIFVGRNHGYHSRGLEDKMGFKREKSSFSQDIPSYVLRNIPFNLFFFFCGIPLLRMIILNSMTFQVFYDPFKPCLCQ